MTKKIYINNVVESTKFFNMKLVVKFLTILLLMLGLKGMNTSVTVSKVGIALVLFFKAILATYKSGLAPRVDQPIDWFLNDSRLVSVKSNKIWYTKFKIFESYCKWASTVGKMLQCRF